MEFKLITRHEYQQYGVLTIYIRYRSSSSKGTWSKRWSKTVWEKLIGSDYPKAPIYVVYARFYALERTKETKGIKEVDKLERSWTINDFSKRKC